MAFWYHTELQYAVSDGGEVRLRDFNITIVDLKDGERHNMQIHQNNIPPLWTTHAKACIPL